MRRLYLSLAARQDLAEIADYIANAAGPSIAIGVVVRIRDTCGLIADTPGEIGVSRPELGESLRSFSVAPYVLFFRYSESEVEIVRVLHARRDIESALGEG